MFFPMPLVELSVQYIKTIILKMMLPGFLLKIRMTLQHTGFQRL